MDRVRPLAFFAICAAVDFVWGCIKWHSFTGGIGAIVGGLPYDGGSLLYFQTIPPRW